MESVISTMVSSLSHVWQIMHSTIFTIGSFRCSLFDVLLAFTIIDLVLMFVFPHYDGNDTDE